MNKERMIGFMMLALLIVITIVYFVFSSEVKNLEAENERLREAILEQEKKSSTTVPSSDKSETESNEVEQSENETTETDENSEASDQNTNINQMNDYDIFITEFIEQVFTNKDIEQQRVELEAMTSDNAYQYLRENYYVLDAVEEANLNNPTEDTAMEGEYESLELESELNDVKTYYTINGDVIESFTVFKLVTDADGETFSGNFVLKSELSRGNNGVQIQEIKTITSLNEPNADQLFK